MNESIVILIIIISLSLYIFTRFRTKQKPTMEERPDIIENIANISGPGEFGIEIVGESFYQEALSNICGGKSPSGHKKIIEAHLIHDDYNPYDNKAIRIEIQGMQVGHLSRKLAREFRKRMVEAGHPGRRAKCQALIVGGWFRNGNEGHFGVRLDLPKEVRKRRSDE